jgi:putative endonuclease
MTNDKKSPLYTGVTSNLIKRAFEHRNGVIDGFTKKYNLKKLVYFEIHFDISEAILKEKRIKKWNKAWKIRMIEEMNPNWNDLYETLV